MMQPKRESWSVVILGQWNARIFSPDWVTTTLFQEAHLDIEFGIANAASVIRYSSADIRLLPTDKSLEFTPRNITDASLERMEEIALRTLQLLPHTPITAIGINFAFSLDDAPENILSLFDLSDQDDLSNARYLIDRTEIQRTLRADEHIINFVCANEGGTTEILLNFHGDASTTQTAIEKLRGQVLRNRDKALTLLKTIYQLSLEPEENT